MTKTIAEMVDSIPHYFLTKVILKAAKKSRDVTLWLYEDKQLPGKEIIHDNEPYKIGLDVQLTSDISKLKTIIVDGIKFMRKENKKV